MSFSALTIESAPKKDGTEKTRTFSVHLLGYLVAEPLWDPGGDAATTRPIWLAYFGTDQETHPFTANLRAGRKAVAPAEAQVFELDGRRHRWTTQKVPQGVVTVAYLPQLFHLEPAGPVSDQLRFVFAPPRWWISQEAERLGSQFGEEAYDAARAALFCAYLDRRTPLPLVHDLAFHLQVYRAALEAGWAQPFSQNRSAALTGRGTEAAGLDAPLACSIEQPELTEFLIQQTTLFHEEIRRGTTRISTGSRLLSEPPETPTELRFPRQVA